MSSAASAPAVLEASSERAASVPWYIWVGVVALTSSSIGGAWDVSWHRSIGRDTFWTPAHMAIYVGGILVGIVGLWLMLSATFGSSQKAREVRAVSVRVLGLRAPLGVFLAGWGGITMLTSAPFDNWWHSAYGLDLKIASPPHMVLLLGLRAVSFGILLLILAAMNRAALSGASNFRRLQILFLYLGGLAVSAQMGYIQFKVGDIFLHRATPYIYIGFAVPILLMTFSQASRLRWAATVTAAVYTIFVIGEILILPLFPATPRVGPVFNEVTHFIPGKFPILIIVPAFALDLLWQRVRDWKPWQAALASGVVFIAVLVAAEWPFANFLMSHASQNRFFGTMYVDYNTNPFGWDRGRRFFFPQQGLILARGLAMAAACAAVSTWIGLGFGRWMRRVQR
jgi:hypothetical protein